MSLMQLWLQKKEQILLSEQKEVVHNSSTKAAGEVPFVIIFSLAHAPFKWKNNQNSFLTHLSAFF